MTAQSSFPARISIVTLGVSDLDRSARFYEDLGWQRSSASSPEIVWFRTADSVLGLFPADELAADAGVPGGGEPSFRGVTLAVNLESPALVDAALQTALKAGAVVVKPPTTTSWGGYSGYFEDPDGHLWELAHNPFFPFTEDGSLDLP
ncbi:VOC family protein [Streptomyces kaniharaensis]|uniref:VOC family protein n=1 Tax=Streptomyces kaniharaensis TaxID=212423 RepID=A0A6N7KWT4_9ACTN|nr:VOC family protein [Streptomyces kaniharaensis]MQS14464.1 VOC family protein [Streptomyces kaniharaensis]